MKKYREKIIIGKAYPTVLGYRWRCFDGKEWHDCDEDGRIKTRRAPKEEAK